MYEYLRADRRGVAGHFGDFMKTIASILMALLSLTGCVNREPFPDGMSMETWMRLHHIEFKP